jgi:hypothetical protein
MKFFQPRFAGIQMRRRAPALTFRRFVIAITIAIITVVTAAVTAPIIVTVINSLADVIFAWLVHIQWGAVGAKMLLATRASHSTSGQTRQASKAVLADTRISKW